jgi:hypothetical protein
MRNRLMRMAMMGAATWAGRRMSRPRAGRGMRVAGTGLSTAAWAVPLGMYLTRRMRGRH